ncbi:inner membrane protein [Pelotomaculum schinkii]|uniref:Inner membrane protein n=2 Tax=Pelotomaculum schinkii TaxID=78350 RepID=A0A4Y7R7Y8_9FIRM|nr:inner membrane protein [Pelotomaculum schinkii]
MTGISFEGGMGDILISTLLGGVMAVLPDVDHPGSMTGRLIRPLSLYLEERWGHRDSPAHTAVFVFISSLTVAALWLLPGHLAGLSTMAPGIAALLGGTSHLVMDSVTRSGIKPWRYLPIPEKWRQKIYRGTLESGKSALERVLACAGLLGAFFISIFKLT